MIGENFDFYSPSNINLKDLDPQLQASLSVMQKLDRPIYEHSVNVAIISLTIGIL